MLLTDCSHTEVSVFSNIKSTGEASLRHVQTETFPSLTRSCDCGLFGLKRLENVKAVSSDHLTQLFWLGK